MICPSCARAMVWNTYAFGWLCPNMANHFVAITTTNTNGYANINDWTIYNG